MIRVFAPAKINLALHVTGLRRDGYHLLDMLVGFADVGDWLTLAAADTAQLTVLGGAQIPAPNIITRICDVFANAPLSIVLEKNLPIASGLGGGSADAAATYRGILAQAGRRADPADMDLLLAIGADVPMCVACNPAQVRGIGEAILPLPQMAALHIVLVNPNVPLPTTDVFKSLIDKNNTDISPLPQGLHDPVILTEFLQNQRNDLQSPAIRIAPIIGDVIHAIAQTGAEIARMSGSGATCFGIYPSADHARRAAETLARNHPHWWVKSALLNGAPDIIPQVIRATT